MSKACPERIAQLRELAGLTKTDLANQLDVSPAAIAQWENGTKNPTAENIAAISSKLRVPMALLLRPRPPEFQYKGPLTFRSWADAATRKANRRAAAFAELVAEIYLWLESKVSFPAAAIPDLSYGSDIEEAAVECRRAWGLGNRPILKLAELLESKGIVLSATSFGDARFDAFSCVVNGRPFILLGEDKGDRARSRFDAAHELGHLVLHQHLSETDFAAPDIRSRAEEEANTFASAFLLPTPTFAADVLSGSLEGFLKLKAKWGVSVQAMAVRAHDLEIISDVQYKALFRQMSFRGWRKARKEPLDEIVPRMTPSLAVKGLEILEANDVIHRWEIPSELPLPLAVLCGVFQTDALDFQPVELKNIISLGSYIQDKPERSEAAEA